MKILYINNIPSPYAVRFFEELSNHCELTVIFERHSASNRDEKWASDHLHGKFLPIFLNGLKIGAENSFCLSITKLIRDGQYDRIIFGDYGTFTSMWCISYLRRHNIPYEISTDGGFANYSEPAWKKKLKTYFIGGAARWFSSGGLTTEYLKYYGADEAKIVEYPFTSLVNEDIFASAPSEDEKLVLRNKLGINPSAKIVIGVGQFIYRKGWDVLVKAASRVHTENIEYYIVGGERDKFEELLKEQGLEVPSNFHIISFLSKEELFEYYKASDISVLPTREDIWGLVINEAMACALPVITTDRCNAGLVLSTPELLVPVGNESALAECMDKAFDSPEHLAKLQQDAINRIKGYTIEEMAQKYL